MTQRNAEFQSYANKWQVAKDSNLQDWISLCMERKGSIFLMFF